MFQNQYKKAIALLKFTKSDSPFYYRFNSSIKLIKLETRYNGSLFTRFFLYAFIKPLRYFSSCIKKGAFAPIISSVFFRQVRLTNPSQFLQFFLAGYI